MGDFEEKNQESENLITDVSSEETSNENYNNDIDVTDAETAVEQYDETGNDVFLHYTGLNMNGFKTIDEGQEVEFDVVEGSKGPQATNVTKL